MKLVFFGRLGDIAPFGLKELDRPAGVHTLSDLRTWLSNEHPILGTALSDQRSLAVVINMTIARDSGYVIVDQDEIASENVWVALEYVARGETPFGIVYATDAQEEKGVSVVATFPDNTHAPIVYPRH